jgi:integrase
MRPWRETTRALYESRLTQVLGWFVSTNPDADLSQETWATLLSPDRCQAHINWLAVRAGKETLNPGHTATLRFVRGLHRFLLGSDATVVEAFTNLARRCEVEERDKAVRMVAYPTLEAALAKLLADYADEKKTAGRKPLSASRLATVQVNTILWGLLVCRALRQRNIRLLRIGNNLVETDGGYELRFEAREMKGHKAFATTCPPELVPVIRDYLRRGYRMLAGREPREGDMLLLTRKGTPFSSGAIGTRVGRLSETLIGKRLNPHIFRHIAATFLAQVRHLTPTELAAFLAHRNPLTLMKFYEITDPTKAAARVDEFRKQVGCDGAARHSHRPT